MRTGLRMPLRVSAALLLVAFGAPVFVACQTGGGGGNVQGNDGGSEPANEKEAVEYKKAIVRCYKTGGTRIVKIMGDLRCY